MKNASKPIKHLRRVIFRGLLLPVRCFTCGYLVGDKFEELERRLGEGQTPSSAMDDMGIRRYCCRRMLLGRMSPIDEVLPYYEALARRKAEFAT